MLCCYQDSTLHSIVIYLILLSKESFQHAGTLCADRSRFALFGKQGMYVSSARALDGQTGRPSALSPGFTILCFRLQ